MKTLKLIACALLAAATALSCKHSDPDNSGKEDPGNQEPGKEDVEPTYNVPAFATGADLSWASEMEAGGIRFKDGNGTVKDLYEILSGIGMNAVRLRVWVDPQYGKWCGKADFLAQARRADKAGMALMVDFHYSDFFADPGRQNIPAAWKADQGDAGKIAARVRAHTVEVLQALKDEGITPEWVQVGNEITNGLIWPTGQIYDSSWKEIGGAWTKVATLVNTGCEAAKEVFPGTLTVVHVDNAWDSKVWWFRKFQEAGGSKYDLIALSHYPQDAGEKTWQEANSLAISNIGALANAFRKKVIVSEIGTRASDPALAAQVLKDFVSKARASDACTGVLYWEPEVFGGWKSAAHKALGWNAYDKGAFTSAGSPSEALVAMMK